MKITRLLVILLTLAIGLGIGLFLYQKSLPDVSLIRSDVSERILHIKGIDSNLSELALRSRYNIDQNYDELSLASLNLEKATKNFEDSYFIGVSEQDDLLGKRFFNYKHEIEGKIELVEIFKSHNSILRNSVKYAPLVGKELIEAAGKENLPEAKAMYTKLVNLVMEYSLHGTPESLGALKFNMPKLKELEEKMPQYTAISKIEFENHLKTVIKEKDETDIYLKKTLLSDTKGNLSALSIAWNKTLAQKEESLILFKKILIGYIAFLLLSVLLIAMMLKKLYTSLDRQVNERTKEVKSAYEELKESEVLLMQNEKMASLGQLVAGVAHEINTPLSYISSNVNLVRDDVNKLQDVLSNVDMISKEIAQPQPSGKRISAMIKKLVLAYRGTGKNETIAEISSLLEDSTYGLNEILELVTSLKDFGRMDRKDMKLSNIDVGLNSTIKICHNSLGKRFLNKNFAENLPEIECMPAQLNQVFMNILNNAIQATDDLSGVIDISTIKNENMIQIEFKDNGNGMNKETINKIFDPFYTTKEVGHGIGLGMSISYKIIKSHNGKILVESEPGYGTTIKIELPIEQPVVDQESHLSLVNQSV